ncbi:MAG: hypothetical protein KKG59_06035 [Nanoarchaeota archaeon]|nr:hypothetical protein [Nanoarchaeota archaeon]
MIILVNPGHGNEPYILGARIADKLASYIGMWGSDCRIIMPDLYGDRQAQIIQSLDLDHELFMDDTLGKLAKPLVMQGSYEDHLDALFFNSAGLEGDINNYLIQEYGLADIEINVGARWSAGFNLFWVFPYIFSELVDRSIPVDFGIAPRKFEYIKHIAEKLEKDVDTFFVPSYNTFSFDTQRQPNPDEISTPPLKPVPPSDTRTIPQNSVYCMMSGTGSEVVTVIARGRELKLAGYHVIVPPWAPGDEFTKMDPGVITNPNVTKVVGRAGWGTMWLCQQTRKEFEPILYTPGDDPEIYFNIKTLEEISLQDGTALQKKQFVNMDGVDYVANQIMGKI